MLGRGLVCLYFLNSVVESRGLYVYYTQLFRRGRLPTGRPPAYPSLSVYLVLPAALLCALGWRVPLTAGLLSCELLREDTALLLRSLRALLTAGTRPNELLLKKLAMLGSVALVFVTGAREAARARSAARRAKLTCRRLSGGGGGSLQLALGEGGGEAAIGRRGSAGLLLGRLLLAALFAFVGQNQVGRIARRDMLWSHRLDPGDGHDSLWLLPQMLLSLPLALGWRTRAVAAALAACMLAEALSSWRFWEYAAGGEREGWRLGKLIHARSHFCTNLAVAGGLVLLAGAGPGRYTVDALLSKKRA